MMQLIVFDLDGTLAESKSPLSAEVGEFLGDLLGVMKVAVISGGSFAQFETQALAYLHAGERLANLILLPTCGTQLFRFRDGWSPGLFRRPQRPGAQHHRRRAHEGSQRFRGRSVRGVG